MFLLLLLLFIEAIPLINLHKVGDSQMKVPFQSNKN